jgi:hypothetical protein
VRICGEDEGSSKEGEIPPYDVIRPLRSPSVGIADASTTASAAAPSAMGSR